MSGPVGDVQKRLRDCVEESLKIPCDCVLVLDSSHSISHSDFETMRRAAMKIVEIGVNGSRFGIVNFSSHAQIVSPLCSNKPHLLNALENCQKLHNSTRTDLGLSQAMSMLTSSLPIPTLVIVLTDGEPDSPRAAKEEAASIQVQGVRVTAVGIGNVRFDGLLDIASPGCSFVLQNFEQLKQAFTLKPQESSFGELSVVVAPPSRPIRVNDDLPLEVRIRNTSTTSVLNGFIEFVANEQFEGATIRIPGELQPGGERVIPIALTSTRGGTSRLTSNLEIKATAHGRPLTTVPTAFELSVNIFSADALNWRPAPIPQAGPTSANILLFGHFGSGKSSFINTLITALSSGKQTYAITGGTNGHVTETLTRWQLGRLCCSAMRKLPHETLMQAALNNSNMKGEEVEAMATWPVNIWDTWGDDGRNYSLDEFEKLLQGWGRSGLHMRDGLEGSIDGEGREQRIMTAVLLFLPQATVLNDEVEVARMCGFYHAAISLGLRPILVVSQIDQEPNPVVRGQMVERLVSQFGAKQDDIALVANYSQSTDEKDFFKDRIALGVLLKALDRTDSFLRGC